MKRSKYEQAFAEWAHAMGLPRYEEEHHFALAEMGRRWRFDFAWPKYRVAVECDGGGYVARGGRHARSSDYEKLNAAAELGWRVLRFTGEMIKKDPEGCVEATRRVLAKAGHTPRKGEKK